MTIDQLLHRLRQAGPCTIALTDAQRLALFRALDAQQKTNAVLLGWLRKGQLVGDSRIRFCAQCGAKVTIAIDQVGAAHFLELTAERRAVATSEERGSRRVRFETTYQLHRCGQRRRQVA